MQELRIDPEFRDKIPPLTEAEFQQLRENILADGEVYEPIAVWNGTIVDGHNRWRIIQQHPEIPYKVKEMDFADKWAAFEWMYRKQLGRRNLTEEQRTYMIGKMYEARKQTQGGDRRSEEFSNGQNVHLKNRRETKDGTAGIIGKEFGVDGRTVRRAEQFANGVDALREVSTVAADKVMAGNTGMNKTEVAALSDKSSDELQEIADTIVRGEKHSEYRKPRRENKGWTKESRESRAQTEAIIADMLDPSTVPEFTVELLIDDIQLNAKVYVDMLRNTLTDHVELLTEENRDVIASAIQESVINEIIKVKELVK